MTGPIHGRSSKPLRVVTLFDRSRMTIPLRAGGHSSTLHVFVKAEWRRGIGFLGLANVLAVPYFHGGAEKRLADAMPVAAQRQGRSLSWRR